MREKGFTLIELMITITVLGIAVALAAPSFSGIIKRQQVRSLADDFYSALSFARAEAVRSGQPIEVIPFDGVSWSKGLLIIDPNEADDDEATLRIVSGKKNMVVTEANNLASIQYDGKGFVRGLDAGGSAVAMDCVQFDLGNASTTRRQVLVLVSGFVAVKEMGGCE